MKLLLAQLDPPRDPMRGAEIAAEVIRGHKGTDLALFPELYLGAYRIGDGDPPPLTVGSEELATVGAACAESGSAAVIGFSELDESDGAVYNAAAGFDGEGRLQAVYRKTHLFGELENAAFVPGREMIALPLAGAVVGPMICFDVEFPEPARELSRVGAELLVTISANMDPYYRDHKLSSQARALDNRRPHAYVNRVGRQPGLVFCGGSRVVAPDGRILAELGRDEEGLLEYELDLGREGQEEANDYLIHLPDRLEARLITASTAS